jgi:hypothetical protein
MAHGEYSHLLWQVRRARWQLLTILPKDWQPPASPE